MKVTGFSFIRNAEKFQYPIVEALQSILPLCDEVVVAVGNSVDNTRNLVSAIDPEKIRIIDTVWDDSLRIGGSVLAVETNKAFNAIGDGADWCIYIQGDEVLHESGYEEIRAAMHQWKDHKEVDGLLFKYRHFYGSFDYIGVSSNWYKREIRVVRNDKSIYSYKDAQGFRKGNNQKLRVKPLNAYIHHYGWVREPGVMFAKQQNFGSLYDREPGSERPVYVGEFDYSHIDALERYQGQHPAVMQQLIEKMNWKFEHDISKNQVKLKDRFKNLFEKMTGRRPFDHNNYRII
jgi:hypothetical protein